MLMFAFRLILLCVILGLGAFSYGQGASGGYDGDLQNHWSTLNNLKLTRTERSHANKTFIPLFAKLLAEDKGFVKDLSVFPRMFVVYPKDSSFRIVTWELFLSKNNSRHFGVVQMASNPEKLYPLFDASDQHLYRTKSILSRQNWFGQVYYDIAEVDVQGTPIYMLFGHDSKDSISDFKIIEPFVFSNEEMFFGASILEFPHDMPPIAKEDVLSRDSLTTRVFLEHKEESVARVSFDILTQRIYYSHLSPIHPSAKETFYNYVPDGTESGYFWDGDLWRWLADPSFIPPTE